MNALSLPSSMEFPPGNWMQDLESCESLPVRGINIHIPAAVALLDGVQRTRPNNNAHRSFIFALRRWPLHLRVAGGRGRGNHETRLKNLLIRLRCTLILRSAIAARSRSRGQIFLCCQSGLLVQHLKKYRVDWEPGRSEV